MDLMPDVEGLTPVHYSGVLAAFISGSIHFYLAPAIGLNALGVSFLFAAVGFYLGSIAVLYDYRRKLVYLLGVPFTAAQIVIWYYMNRIPLEVFLRGEPFLDFVDKIAQIILIIILVYLYWKE